jgi:hypothetical protein
MCIVSPKDLLGPHELQATSTMHGASSCKVLCALRSDVPFAPFSPPFAPRFLANVSSFGPGGRLRPGRRPPGPVRRPPGPVRRPPGPVRRPPGKKGGLPLCCRLVKGVPGLRVLGLSLGGSLENSCLI